MLVLPVVVSVALLTGESSGRTEAGPSGLKLERVPGSPAHLCFHKKRSKPPGSLCSCMTSAPPAPLLPHLPSDGGSTSFLSAPLLRGSHISSEKLHLPLHSQLSFWIDSKYCLPWILEMSGNLYPATSRLTEVMLLVYNPHP